MEPSLFPRGRVTVLSPSSEEGVHKPPEFRDAQVLSSWLPPLLTTKCRLLVIQKVYFTVLTRDSSHDPIRKEQCSSTRTLAHYISSRKLVQLGLGPSLGHISLVWTQHQGVSVSRELCEWCFPGPRLHCKTEELKQICLFKLFFSFDC